MHILELCLSPDFGGLEIHARDFSRWLADRKDCQLFLALQQGSRLDQALQPLARPVCYFIAKAGKFDFSKAKQLAAFITQNKIDVVHVHWKNDLPLAALTKRLCKTKFKIVHTRQMNMPGAKKGLYHRYIYASLDLFVAITDYIKEQAEKNLPLAKEKIARIYYGVAAPEAENRPEHTAGLKAQFNFGENFAIGLFGRIEEFKGQHLLLEAMERLKNEGITIHAGIVGAAFNAGYEKSLRHMAIDKGIDDRVHFFGFYDKPVELMACFDVIVLTTKNETFGLVLVEAMQAGLPVIGSNAGGVPEIIDHGETGLLFESWNSADLAEKIKMLYNDSALRQRLARAGREKARRQFDLNTQYEKVLQAMKGLL